MNNNKRAILNLQSELATVSSAILGIIEGGQSVSIGDMTYTEVNINALREREKDLERKLGALTGERPVALPVSFSNFPR